MESSEHDESAEPSRADAETATGRPGGGAGGGFSLFVIDARFRGVTRTELCVHADSSLRLATGQSPVARAPARRYTIGRYCGAGAGRLLTESSGPSHAHVTATGTDTFGQVHNVSNKYVGVPASCVRLYEPRRAYSEVPRSTVGAE